MPIPYDLLRVIWWALLGILLILFAVLDGYNLGSAMLLPFVGRTDDERRQVRDWAGISRPQVYYSLEQLARLRLIRAADSEARLAGPVPGNACHAEPGPGRQQVGPAGAGRPRRQGRPQPGPEGSQPGRAGGPRGCG